MLSQECGIPVKTESKFMNKWIKCGLPWTYYGDWMALPKPPIFTKQIKKLFGKTIGQAYGAIPVKVTKSKEYKSAVREYQAFRNKVEAWIKEQPESEAYNEKMKQLDEAEKQKSFCGRELNKPGTFIEISDNKIVKQLLIGDINTLGGVCDDCMGFSKDTIVVRYKVLER